MKRTNRQGYRVTVDGRFLNADQRVLKKFMTLFRKTEKENPEPEDVQALRQLLEDAPELWAAMSHLADASVHAILEHGFAPSARVLTEIEVEQMKRNYAYEDASVLERMLIDQVIVSWLQLHRTQVSYEGIRQGGVSLPLSEFWERRLTACQSRFLRACETLARVRKLARPSAMQVNIAKQQLNVAQLARQGEGEVAELPPPDEG